MSGENNSIDGLAISRGEIYYSLRSRLPADHDRLIGRVESSSGAPSSVHVAGMIALSTICIRDCIYCGFRASVSAGERFRLSRSEILEAAERARRAGIKWLILKSGDDPGMSPDVVAELIRDLASEMGFYISLSMGERESSVFVRWREAGASSYWLRHETCDPHLYRRIRPSMYWVDRMRTINKIRQAGFDICTGIMVGIPNQSYESLMDDLIMISEQKPLAVVIEPYMPPKESKGYQLLQKPENLIVEPDRRTIEKAIAVSRLLSPGLLITLSRAHANAFNALDRIDLFQAGADMVALDFTPPRFLEFEGQTPFTGCPVADDDSMAQTLDKLKRLGLEPVFDPPPLPAAN